MEIKFNTPGWRDVLLVSLFVSSLAFNIFFAVRLAQVDRVSLNTSRDLTRLCNEAANLERQNELFRDTLTTLDWTGYYLRKKIQVSLPCDAFMDQCVKEGNAGLMLR